MLGGVFEARCYSKGKGHLMGRRSSIAVPIMALLLALLAAVPAGAQELQGTTAEGARSPGQHVVTATGVLKEQGVTVYQYGTHRIVDERTGLSYALRIRPAMRPSQYVGRRVTIVGTKVPGYPVDFGPPLLAVNRILPATSPCSNPMLKIYCPPLSANTAGTR